MKRILFIILLLTFISSASAGNFRGLGLLEFQYDNDNYYKVKSISVYNFRLGSLCPFIETDFYSASFIKNAYTNYNIGFTIGSAFGAQMLFMALASENKNRELILALIGSLFNGKQGALLKLGNFNYKLVKKGNDPGVFLSIYTKNDFDFYILSNLLFRETPGVGIGLVSFGNGMMNFGIGRSIYFCKGNKFYSNYSLNFGINILVTAISRVSTNKLSGDSLNTRQ
jgi:hypothetical protein